MQNFKLTENPPFFIHAVSGWAFTNLNKMFNNNQIQKVEIDQENKKLYVYYVQDNSHLMSNPPPPPSYYREVFSFDKLEFIEKEYAKVERGFEKVTWS